jgi:hypothetical protein
MSSLREGGRMSDGRIWDTGEEKAMTSPEEIARERIAAELHDLYLATARRFGWPLRVSVDCAYDKLSEPAKELDRAFADWHLAALAASEQRAENWRNDFQEACRQRDASEQRIRELERELGR